VHPYLRRRDKLEPVSYPSAAVESVLKRTLGVPIFQEQVIKLAMVAAGFSGGEADGLRRAMAAWRRKGGLDKYEDKLINGMRKNGYSEQFARQIYAQIKGFGEYGFPESHSASFALLAYTSSWLKRYHPAVFLAALLNSQPMGFYAPSQLIQDARRRRDNGAGDIEVLPVDVRYSDWDCTLERGKSATVALEVSATAPTLTMAGIGASVIQLHSHSFAEENISSWNDRAENASRSSEESSAVYRFDTDKSLRSKTDARTPRVESATPPPAVRLGLRHVKGLSEAAAHRLMAARDEAPFESALDLTRRACLDKRDRSALASAGALKGLAGHRYRARWAVAGVEPERPLLANIPIPEAIPLLRAPTEGADIVADYAHLGFTLGRHPLALLRRQLGRLDAVPALAVRALPHGAHVRTAGIVIGRQHPDSAKGVIFITLEDETGNTNLVIWPKLVERYQRIVTQARLMFVDGEVQREGEVQHVVAKRLEDRTALLGALLTRSRDFH
jgi:error-prone DNA polymerase